MKAGEHLKPLTWGNPKIFYDGRFRDRYIGENKFLFTTKELNFIKQLDPWKLRPIIKKCTLCGDRYIPTPQSDKVCIKCNYIG